MSQVKIVAEIGVNHNGSIDQAVFMAEAAKKAGADYVKFQLWRKHRWPDIAHLRLSHRDIIELKKHCVSEDISWFCTGFDLDSLQFLQSLEQRIWKIPSGLVANKTYLNYIKQLPGEFILSTGGCTALETELLIRREFRGTDITVLRCVSKYPTPFEDIKLRGAFPIGLRKYGISDHSEGIEIPIAAVALGATMVEKHFTFNINAGGPDHKASLEPDQFEEMVCSIRNVEKALGSYGTEFSEEDRHRTINIRKRMEDV